MLDVSLPWTKPELLSMKTRKTSNTRGGMENFLKWEKEKRIRWVDEKVTQPDELIDGGGWWQRRA